MQARGMSSSELARRAGVKTTFIYDVLRGKSHNPSILRLSKVADALHIPIAHLLDQNAPFTPDEINTQVTLLPYIGPTPEAKPMSFHIEWLRQQCLGKMQNLRLFVVVSHSMLPTIREQDTVMLDISHSTPAPGIFLFSHQGKRIIGRIDGHESPASAPAVCFDNPDYSPPFTTASEADIWGRVIWLSRTF